MCNKVHLNENVRCTSGASVNTYFGAVCVCVYIYKFMELFQFLAPGKLSSAPVSRGGPILKKVPQQ